MRKSLFFFVVAAMICGCSQSPEVTVLDYGCLSTGEKVHKYIMKNPAGSSVAVTDYGARYVSVFVPDRNGELKDIVIGFDDVASYEAGQKSYRFMGCVIGRYANRSFFDKNAVNIEKEFYERRTGNESSVSLRDVTGNLNYRSNEVTKLDKFFDYETEAKITMSVEKNRQKIEATIYSHNTIFRVEQVTSDMYVTMDKVIDDMERQIRKNKTRLEKKLRKDAFVDLGVSDVPVEEETEFNIIKTKSFTTKPMSNEEAILQMNLLGHTFFVYKNSENEKNSIVYKRKDGNYGIIEIN